MKLICGTYERYIGTSTLDGCSCAACIDAYKARMKARTKFTYYERSTPIKRSTPADRRSAEDRARGAERQRLYRARKLAS